LLLLITAALYAPVAEHDFISYDDDTYITDNPQLRGGLTATNLLAAVTSFRGAIWQPLTWVSHLIDVQLFGLQPAGHHLHSVLLHGLAAVLLLGVLYRATGALAPSLFVAAAFAWHPLRVESVAWAAERKDVLAACWWWATLALWLRYLSRPSRGRYAAVVAALAAGLMAKPVLVTLPAALLLFDLWPLRRWHRADGWPAMVPLVREKLPLLLPVVAAGVLTVLAERRWGAVASLTDLPLGSRLANALLAWVGYLGKTLWPVDLAVLYPLPLAPPSGWAALACLAGLATLTGLAWRAVDRAPWLLAGWLWYLGVLVPMIGLVQVGSHALADRFTYLPQVGLWFAVAGTAAAWADRRPALRPFLVGLAVLVLVAWAWQTRQQLAYWRHSTTLFARALAVTEGNYVMHTNLGIEQGRAGDLAGAAGHFDAALAINPEYAPAWNNRGIVLASQGRLAEAVAHYRRAVALQPGYARAHNNLAAALMSLGDLAGAEAACRQALAVDPEYLGAWNNLGIVQAARGETRAASATFSRLLELAPEHPEARRNLEYLQRAAAAGAP
jgi:Flp pilus assembly protein TadD